MTAGKPNPFAPFSHELSVEFSRAYDDAKILFVRHVLVVGSIPEEVPQVWTVATNPTLIFSIIRDPPGGASTATLVEGSTISTSMAIDGAHAAQLEDSFNFGASVGAGVQIENTVGYRGCSIEKNVITIGGKAALATRTLPRTSPSRVRRRGTSTSESASPSASARPTRRTSRASRPTSSSAAAPTCASSRRSRSTRRRRRIAIQRSSVSAASRPWSSYPSRSARGS